MTLEWPAGFMKSSGSTTPKRGELPGPARNSSARCGDPTELAWGAFVPFLLLGCPRLSIARLDLRVRGVGAVCAVMEFSLPIGPIQNHCDKGW